MLSIGSKVAQGLDDAQQITLVSLSLKCIHVYTNTNTLTHARTHTCQLQQRPPREMNNNLRAGSEIKIPSILAELAVTKAQQSRDSVETERRQSRYSVETERDNNIMSDLLASQKTACSSVSLTHHLPLLVILVFLLFVSSFDISLTLAMPLGGSETTASCVKWFQLQFDKEEGARSKNKK